MIIEIKIPELGESVSFAELASWLVKDGDIVEKDQEIAEIDSDKATLALPVEEGGQIRLIVKEGTKVKVGDVVCTIDTSKAGEAKPKTEVKEEKPEPAKKEPVAEKPVPKIEVKAPESEDLRISVSPVAGKIMQEENINPEDVLHSKLLRITKNDVELYKQQAPVARRSINRTEDRQELTPLRKKLAERLVKAKNEGAMLTTFNEVDLSDVIAIRKKYQQQFTETHAIKLGFMSFFTKAVTLALDEFPAVNASLEGDELIYHHYKDIGIAVSTQKGLMVPVIRNAETLSLADIEKQIADLADKARRKRLTLDEMSGGTFTITNGGVFGSMLSTPIINPPQVGILGMHNIQERAVVIDGKVEIRPMMYIALSYDHRVIDGKDSVSFLVKIKQLLENPVELIDGKDSIKVLLGI